MVILWIHLVGFKGLNICTNVNQPFFSAKKLVKHYLFGWTQLGLWTLGFHNGELMKTFTSLIEWERLYEHG